MREHASVIMLKFSRVELLSGSSSGSSSLSGSSNLSLSGSSSGSLFFNLLYYSLLSGSNVCLLSSSGSSSV